MHSVLFILDKPNTDEVDNMQAWSKFQTTVLEIIKNHPETRRLDENSLLLDLQSELPSFSSLVNISQAWKLSYQVLFFEEEPQWIQYPS